MTGGGPDRPAVIAIVGATATGKSAVGLALAHALGGEIVNADSMQFYRGMDIGTAKLPVTEREGVVHHLIDTLDVVEDASVAQFRDQARAAIDDIHDRGLRAIVVGGSGLYVRALLDAFEFPEPDPVVRARLAARAEAEGPGVLFRELTALDPAAAAKMQPQNAKRIVRALEVIELTGKPFSSTLPTREYEIPAVQVALTLPYPELDQRIAGRVEAMWDAGLVAETQALIGRGIRQGVTAQRAVGYAETLRHLDGEMDAAATRDLIAQHTRRLARRQERWFRPDDRVRWVEAPATPADVDRAARDAIAAVGTLEP